MTFSGLNFVGIFLASLVSLVSGAIWFGPKTFYPVWMKLRGHLTGNLDKNHKPAVLFGGTFVSILVQNITLGLIINSLQKHNPNIGVVDGAGIGFALGVGISMFSSLSHRLFGGDGFKLWVIETANDAINLTIAGAIIASLS